jgi:MSHA biogenesis protein MshP
VRRPGGITEQQGLGLVSAIFILVIMASAGAFMVSLGGVQRTTATQALQSSRAYHAAHSGIEWGVFQVIDTSSCPGGTMFVLSEGGLIGFATAVSCTSSVHTENGVSATIYQITSIATYGAFGTPDYVRRRLQVTVTDAS